MAESRNRGQLTVTVRYTDSMSSIHHVVRPFAQVDSFYEQESVQDVRNRAPEKIGTDCGWLALYGFVDPRRRRYVSEEGLVFTSDLRKGYVPVFLVQSISRGNESVEINFRRYRRRKPSLVSFAVTTVVI